MSSVVGWGASMGRLYDRKDLAFNLQYWNRMEMEFHAAIANGDIAASELNNVISDPMACDCASPCGRKHFKHTLQRDWFGLQRKREQMKLLRTGSLLRDLERARRDFDACPKCYQGVGKGGKTKDVACDEHKEPLNKAKSAVYWAGERNIAERNSRGQKRADGLSTAQEALEGLPVSSTSSGELNRWEAWYQRDKAAGIWPKDAQYYDTTPDYKGWLEMIREIEEMTESEYLTELQRLREQEQELEQMQTRQVKLKRDSRYTITSV